MDGEELAHKLGVPYRRTEPRRGDEEHYELTSTVIRFFTLDDPRHTMAGLDGTTIPMGEPVEQVRRRFGGDEGSIEDPFGKSLPVRIPPDIRDGEGNYLAVVFHLRKRGDADVQAETG